MGNMSINSKLVETDGKRGRCREIIVDQRWSRRRQTCLHVERTMSTWETKWLRGGVSDAESIEGHEVREPRRPEQPVGSNVQEIEDHVLTGHACFRSWCAACVQGRGRAERHQGKGRKKLEYGSKVPVVSCDYYFLGARNRISEAEVEQRADSPVLVMHDGVTKSIFAHLISAKGVDFPSCEKVVKMIVKDLDTLGHHRVVFRCDNEPSILALLWALKLAWTGDVVQETSAEGGPIQRCREFTKRRQMTRQIDQVGSSASGVEVPVHDLLTWLVSYATSTVGFQWVETARQHTKEMWEGVLFSPWHNSMSECGGCFCSHPTVVWVLWIHDLSKEGTWDRWMDQTQCLLDCEWCGESPNN